MKLLRHVLNDLGSSDPNLGTRNARKSIYSFKFQPRIQPNFETQFWSFVRVMTS